MKRGHTLTKRLHIRPYRASDYIAWFESNSNSLPKQSKYDHGPYSAKECSKEIFKTLLEKYKKMDGAEGTYVWGVFEKRSGRLIGVLDISIICRGPLQVANLGYRVFNRYWRKGYGTEFVRAGIKLGLKDLKLNRLEAVIDLDNKASIRLARSSGMVCEGIRKKYFYQNGNWDDQIIFSGQRAQWRLPPLQIK